MSVSCSGDVTTSDGIVIAQHKTEDIPASVDHVRYAVLDDIGNREYLSSEFPVSALHKLEGIPTNTTAIVTEFHTENEEELSEDVQSISFTGGDLMMLPQYSMTQFLEKRLAIVDVDKMTGNILVRGNLPLVKKGTNACYLGQDRCFAYDEINAKMKERMQKIDSSFDFNIEEYDVIEFVLHDGAGNRPELTVEMNALGLDVKNITCGAKWLPYQGCDAWDPKVIYTSIKEEKKLWGLVWWPMYPCPNMPCDDTKKIVDDSTETEIALNRFHFNDASAYLKTLLTTRSDSGKKRLIYFHCIQGADRTGTLHIAYIMDNNPQLSFVDAIDRAWKGIREGSEDPQLDYKGDDVKPMCRFVGIAYRYCQEQNKDNPARCELPTSWKDTKLCKQP